MRKVSYEEKLGWTDRMSPLPLLKAAEGCWVPLFENSEGKVEGGIECEVVGGEGGCLRFSIKNTQTPEQVLFICFGVHAMGNVI